MFRVRTLVLTCCVVALSALHVAAQSADDLRGVIQKAIIAHGGKENLSKYQASTIKYKGTLELMGKTVPITGETSVQKPDKLKNALSMEIDGKMIDVTQVFNGKNLWLAIMGKTTEIKDAKAIKEMREALIAENVSSLVAIDATYELGALGDVKVNGKDTVGIRVGKKGERDVSLFFDKKTFLLAKTEMRTYDMAAGQEVTQEKFFSDYKERQGLKSPNHVAVHKDGNRFIDLELIDSQAFEKLDDAAFAMP